MSNRKQTPGGEILVYAAEDGASRIRVLLENETVWLTQAMVAKLHQRTSQNRTRNIRGIYEEGELRPKATCKEYLIVCREGLRQVERPAWKQSRKRQENAGVKTRWRAAA